MSEVMSLKIFTYTILAAVLLSSGCQTADVRPTTGSCSWNDAADTSRLHPKADEWKGILEKYTRKGLPGISALIEDEDGQWIGVSGYADLENGVKYQPCHPGKAASITKLMVGTLCHMLQEQGRWSLDDPLSKYISKDILDRIPNASQSSIRNCLQHTTGIYDITSDADFYLAVLNNPNRQWRSEDVLKFAYDKPAAFDVGDTCLYSNTNTTFVVMCIEKLLGRPHEEVLRELIWQPLGMNSTYLQGRDALPDFVTQGYYDLYNNNTLVNVSNLITASGNGYGGVYSTIFDLQKFMKALFFDKTLLRESSLNDLMSFRNEDDNDALSSGAMQKFRSFSPHLGVGHSGRDLGYSADFFFFPTRNNRIMIFFVNYGTNADSKLRETFREFEKELVFSIIR